jgi:[protein-PII] uridylyltransferase
MDREPGPRLEPLDGHALRHELTALAHAQADPVRLRAAALALIKQRFRDAREQVRADFESGAHDGPGAAKALSDAQDETIQVLYDFATKHFYYAQNPTQAERIAIVATGGYGRGQLAPQSDIDLLFLRPYKETPWGESVIEFILYMLWDLGLKVGHATRSLDDCIRLSRQDISIRTALLEARFLWGERKLYDELRRRYRAEVAAGTALHFVAAKMAERDRRHVKQGASRYLVEPNVKEGKGGLRDLQTLYWIGKDVYGVDDPSELVRHALFTREEYEQFRDAEAFLWKVRFHLHYLTGRPEERITFDIQPELARRFGFGEQDPRRAVERFMREYFLAAKTVGDLTRIFCAALEEQNRKPRPALTRLLAGLLKSRSDETFFVDNGRLYAAPDAFAREPSNLIRIFEEADARGVDVHPAAMRTVTRCLGGIDETLRNDPEANRSFFAILTSRHDPERALRWLNESGVFGRFVPEFGRVVALMQFNMYHHFTVDEHLIRAVGNVAAIERGDLNAEHPLASDIVKRIKQRDALYAAMLLHDIAKGLPGDHSDAGAEIAQRLCPRWGLSEEDTDTVVWLVRNHLVMSDTAQRRDLSDPKTVRDFVEAVQSPELLRLLLVLTVADIRAVGPGVWNGWKGQLLRQLYYEAEAAMSGASPRRDTDVAETKAALGQRLRDLPQDRGDKALTRLGDGYWLAFGLDELERHARLLLSAEAEAGQFALIAESDDFRAVTRIAVAAADRQGLFSRLAGAITLSGGSIVDARIFTTVDGFALDVFSVQDADGGPFGDAARVERLRSNIARVLADGGKPQSLFGTRSLRRQARGFSVKPRIAFDNEASTVATVIEVEALDRPGLLYDITRALSEAGLSISSAVVATYGERAVDVFYVRDKFGHKIVYPDRFEAIRSRLAEPLHAGPLEAARA